VLFQGTVKTRSCSSMEDMLLSCLFTW